MPNKFVSFLEAVGKDFLKGLNYAIPVASAVASVVSVGNPALGAIINTSIGVVLSTEQKFAAAGKQSGTGPQKAAEALTILYPAFEQIFGQYGVQIDKGNVEKYIDAIVAALNAFPPIPAPAPAPAASTAKPVTFVTTAAAGVTTPAISVQPPSPPTPDPAAPQAGG